MIDGGSLFLGSFLGFLLGVISVIIYVVISKKGSIERLHTDWVYLRLLDIHDEYKNKHTRDLQKTWTSEVKKLLNSEDGIYLEEIRSGLENKMELINKKVKENYEKNIKPIEKSIEKIHEKEGRVSARMKALLKKLDGETNSERKLRKWRSGISDVNCVFNEKIEREILSDIPKLVKKRISILP